MKRGTQEKKTVLFLRKRLLFSQVSLFIFGRLSYVTALVLSTLRYILFHSPDPATNSVIINIGFQEFVVCLIVFLKQDLKNCENAVFVDSELVVGSCHEI